MRSIHGISSSVVVENSEKKFDLHSTINFPAVATFMKKVNDWCEAGELMSLPIDFHLSKEKSFFLQEDGKYIENHQLGLNHEFFTSKVGKKFIEFEQSHINIDPEIHSGTTLLLNKEKIIEKLRTEIGKDFKNGFCYGQATAVIIANCKKPLNSARAVVMHAQKAHIVFFQAMSNLRYLYRRLMKTIIRENPDKKTIEQKTAIESRKTKLIKNFFDQHRVDELQYLEKIADVKNTSYWKCGETDSEKIITRLKETKADILRLTFPRKESEEHTISIFLQPYFWIYDNLIGLLSYKNRDALFDDMSRYVKKILGVRLNGSCKIVIEGFNRISNIRTKSTKTDIESV